MRIAYFDCFSGASGDMIVGALLAAGWSASELEATVSALHIEDCRASAATVTKQGLAATKVTFAYPDDPPTRRLGELFRIVRDSELSSSVKDDALRVLRRMGEAEARVHGLEVPLEELHLHELGSLDTVLDVVCAAAGLRSLAIEAVSVSPMALGGGVVRTAHGILPVPTPAVAELVRGLQVVGGKPDDGELVTPTGAALLREFAASAATIPEMVVQRVGYGAGERERAVPNVLRLWIGESGGDGLVDEVVEIAANLDDMNPEFYGPLMERLLDKGALDVYLVPVIMKKGRPGILLGVLCDRTHVPSLEEVLFEETTTLGIRHSTVRRSKLDREFVAVETAYGVVRVKIGKRKGKAITVAPELDDCRRVSEAQGVPVRAVYDAARLAYLGRRAI